MHQEVYEMLVKSKEDITLVLVNLYKILSWNKYYNMILSWQKAGHRDQVLQLSYQYSPQHHPVQIHQQGCIIVKEERF